MAKRVIFIGLSGYGYPHTRVRCYHFQRELARHRDIESTVLSFRDHLAEGLSEAAMYRLSDRQKLRLTWKALRRLYPERGSLFYIQKAHFHSAAPFLLHRLGRNSYIFDYDDYDVELSNFFAKGRWNRLLFGSHRWDVITERMARRALCCVAASHELMDYLGAFHDKVYYIPTGVDTDAFQPKSYGAHLAPVVFLWTGIVWGEPILRSVRLLLDCLRAVCHQRLEVELRIIGGGDRYQDLRVTVREDYPDLPVQLFDWLDPKEMPEQLRQADVGCLPLDHFSANRWVRSKSPTKLFEYMAAALPVVASALGEATYVIQDGKNGFLAHTQEEMTRQMTLLARDAQLRRQLGQAARRRVEEKFSLRVLGDTLHQVLQEQGWGGAR